MLKMISKRIMIFGIIMSSYLPVKAGVYYISTGGNDNSGNGSKNAPWKTLNKACHMVRLQGDTIFVMAGIYDEAVTSYLSAGVSLTGQGENSVITSSSLKAEWTPVIDMRSQKVENGNQSISFLKFDGDSLVTAQALWIAKRNNVIIHHCVFSNFNYTGIIWTGDGGSAGNDPYDKPVYPKKYVIGSVFHDNIMRNCAMNTPYDWGRGALYIGGHEGMLLYNNVIIQNQRADGHNGYPIKAFANGGFMKGWKVYNNTITKTDAGTGSWPFAIEGAFYEGCEFYNNTLTGAIDINFIHKGSYDYGVYIHDNVLGPKDPSRICYEGIILEFGTEGVIIERNHIRNCAVGIHHTMRYPEPWVKNVKVRYNLFSNLGADNTQHYHSAIRFGETEYNYSIEDYQIYNNIFQGNPSSTPYFGIHMRGFKTATNIKVLNNIFMNFSWTWFDSNRGDYFTNLIVQNNIFYKNANSNSPKITGVPKNYFYEGNIMTNPYLNPDAELRPKPGSPVKDAGKLIPGEKLHDLDGVLVDNTPNIGCYEKTADKQSGHVSKAIK
jgi:hypothetical protein